MSSKTSALYQLICSFIECAKANKQQPSPPYNILIPAISQGAGEKGEEDPLLVSLKKNYPCEVHNEFAFEPYQKIIRLGDPYWNLGMAIAEVQVLVDKEQRHENEYITDKLLCGGLLLGTVNL